MSLAAPGPVAAPLSVDSLRAERLARLTSSMRRRGVDALLTADPINILYACDARNMTVFSMMSPARFCLVFADGYLVLWEFAGCEHLVAAGSVNELRAAPSITATGGPGVAERAAAFAAEVHQLCTERSGGARYSLGVEKVDFLFTDALRTCGASLVDATEAFSDARRVKQPSEIAVIREAIRRVERSALALADSVADGCTENAVWAEFHRSFIASDGEYVSTRLFQSGPRTFPYFQESSDRVMRTGEIVCLDTDALGYRGYAVDFSRSFVVGGSASSRQRELHAVATDQLETNAGLLRPGLSFESFARSSWEVPSKVRPYAYYILGHGLGLCGEYPNVPFPPAILPGEFEPGMVFCVESYVGDAETGQGVKVEDQFLITPEGAERLTTFPVAAAFSG